MADEVEQDPAQHWDARYSERERVWSGNPNAALVATTESFPPGRALDLGCGEGADSVWLAERGWKVTAVDISPIALGRAEALAATRRVPEGQITWRLEDLASWEPSSAPDAPYDLVSACFLHSKIDFAREVVLRRAAGAVMPGGHLLVVAHAEPPPWAKDHDDHDHHLLSPADELASLELGEDWSIVTNEVRTREATGPDGEHATLRDVVTLARRHR